VKALQYNIAGCAISQVPRLLNVSEDVWRNKVTPLVWALHGAVDVLDLMRRFAPNNHVPMLPRNITGITDSFPKIIYGGCLKNPKYGYKCGKGSIVCTFDGTIIDYQGLSYGNRCDMDFIQHHADALNLRNWEFLLGDMAYTSHPRCLTQYKMNRALTNTEVIHNLVVGFYRSRVEAVIGDLKIGKGIFSLLWSSDMETLEGLLKLEVHATQLEQDMMGHPHYAEVEGNWPHQAEAGQPA
jgi:hypothetical protein